MDSQFALFSTHFPIRILVVLMTLGLTFDRSSAQLQFSNFIVGKNTIMHIEPDGTTSLKPYDAIHGDDYHYSFFQLLSDNSGNPIAKTGIKYYRYENGLSTGGSEVCTLNYLNNTLIHQNHKSSHYYCNFLAHLNIYI